jgi:hypothetical protein
VLGLVLSAALGGFALSARGGAATFEPSASGGVFTSADWDSVKQRVAQRGFSAASVRVVTATGGRQSGHTLALLAASRPTGATCFIPARSTALGASICRLTRPLTVFAMRDHFAEVGRDGRRKLVAATDLVGLVRPGVASVAVRSNALGRAGMQGQPLFTVPGGLAFGGGFRGVAASVIARGSGGEVVSRLSFRK